MEGQGPQPPFALFGYAGATFDNLFRDCIAPQQQQHPMPPSLAYRRRASMPNPPPPSRSAPVPSLTPPPLLFSQQQHAHASTASAAAAAAPKPYRPIASAAVLLYSPATSTTSSPSVSPSPSPFEAQQGDWAEEITNRPDNLISRDRAAAAAYGGGGGAVFGAFGSSFASGTATGSALSSPALSSCDGESAASSPGSLFMLPASVAATNAAAVRLTRSPRTSIGGQQPPQWRPQTQTQSQTASSSSPPVSAVAQMQAQVPVQPPSMALQQQSLQTRHATTPVTSPQPPISPPPQHPQSCYTVIDVTPELPTFFPRGMRNPASPPPSQQNAVQSTPSSAVPIVVADKRKSLSAAAMGPDPKLLASSAPFGWSGSQQPVQQQSPQQRSWRETPIGSVPTNLDEEQSYVMPRSSPEASPSSWRRSPALTIPSPAIVAAAAAVTAPPAQNQQQPRTDAATQQATVTPQRPRALAAAVKPSPAVMAQLPVSPPPPQLPQQPQQQPSPQPTAAVVPNLALTQAAFDDGFSPRTPNGQELFSLFSGSPISKAFYPRSKSPTFSPLASPPGLQPQLGAPMFNPSSSMRQLPMHPPVGFGAPSMSPQPFAQPMPQAMPMPEVRHRVLSSPSVPALPPSARRMYDAGVPKMVFSARAPAPAAASMFMSPPTTPLAAPSQQQQQQQQQQQSLATPPTPTVGDEDDSRDESEDGTGDGRQSGSTASSVASSSSRQRVKQMLKRLKQDSTAAGRGGLRELISFFVQSEGAGGNDRWLIMLELADMAKREGDLEMARSLYRLVTKLKAKKSQCWLEYAKMEEECGQLEHSRTILRRGLKQCPFCEALMIKSLKVDEKLGNLASAHALLARLRDQPMEKTWRTILEGALLEARLGNSDVARKVFHYLMRNVPWYGPIFQEAYRFEERCEKYDKALRVVDQGLHENPKYGPLWFSALRLYEKVAPEKLRPALQSASELLLKDLKWKVHFESAQIEERAGNIEAARAAYGKAAEHCPGNLEWKVWFGASRTELISGNVDTARSLISRALSKVPAKMLPAVILEQARLEEYAGCPDAARRILDDAKVSAKHEWKVFLERVLLEIRAGDIEAAVNQVKEALLVHAGTGRLWAVYIQLRAPLGLEEQSKVFNRALREVPKSGEVWCEGARIFIKQRRHKEARECLAYAAQFTPQYGDTFVEYLRNELAETGTFSEPCLLEQQCVNAEPNYGPLWLYCKERALDSPKQVLRSARQLLRNAFALQRASAREVEMISDVNVMFAGCRQLSNDQRLKLVFGSDGIKP